MIGQRAKTVAEWSERMHAAKPPTEDDVTVLLDVRRLDSKESVEAWLREVEALRVLEAVTLTNSGPSLDLNRLLKGGRSVTQQGDRHW